MKQNAMAQVKHISSAAITIKIQHSGAHKIAGKGIKRKLHPFHPHASHIQYIHIYTVYIYIYIYE